MNDFDRYIEFGLRQMLDPVVCLTAPRRRPLTSMGSPFLAVISPPLELATEALPGGETVAVPFLRVLP
jgi:hypothetical protein